MTVSKRTFLTWWLGGLAAFAVTLVLHIPLTIDAVPGGIGDHQSAPDAATVNAIHAEWQAAGVYGQAHWAMATDLVFIGIFGIGCVLASMHYRARKPAMLRLLGGVALVCGAVFLVADYGETIAQFVQLIQNRGSDGLAQLASTLRPIKMASWIGGFLSVLVAIIVDRVSSSHA